MSEVETIATPKKTIDVVVVETHHQTYRVEAIDQKQAEDRLRRWFHDPAVFVPGVVEVGPSELARWQLRGKKKATTPKA